MAAPAKIISIFKDESLTFPQIAQGCAEQLPVFFSHPEYTHVCITINTQDYFSIGFIKSKTRISSKVFVPKKCKGAISIYISKDVPKNARLFLKSEKETIESIAREFEAYIHNMSLEQFIMNSEKRYRLLAENSVDAIWIMDPLLNFTYVSPSIYEMTGFNQEEWIGTNLSEHATRKEFLKMAAQAVRAMKNYKEFKYVIFPANFLRKDGSEMTVEIIGKLLKNQSGFPIGLQGSARDIAERIKADQAIKETERKYINSVEQLHLAGKKLGQSLVLQNVYHNLHEIISQAMPCDGMIVSSFERSTKMLTCKAMFHEGQQVDASNFPRIPLEPKGKGTQSQVVQSGEALYLADYRAHQQHSKSSYYVNKDGIFKPEKIPDDEPVTSSAILVPLKRENTVIGVIQVTSYKLDAYTNDNLQFLEAFAPQISSATTNAALFEETQLSQKVLQETLQGTIETLARAVETRDPYTAGHQRHVADLAAAIAANLDLDPEQIDGIRLAGIVHDVGKINIPAEILSKPGKLSALEFELIKEHPQTAADLLSDIKFPWPITVFILQHHEKMDGSGYPQGLKGDQIAFEARILTVADIVEAMSAHRPYRPALGIEKALEQIKQDRGSLLDPQVVDACLKIFENGYQFPQAGL